jgi:hypothetical protein
VAELRRWARDPFGKPWGDIEDPTRVAHRLGQFAPSEGVTGTMQRDGTRERAELTLVQDNHLR